MSRIIKHDKPLSERDINYLKSRGRYDEIERNRKKFANAKTTEAKQDSPKPAETSEAKNEGGQKLSLDADIFEKVKGLSATDLEHELKSHQIAVPQTEREQRISLAKYLQAQREKK